MFAQQTHCFYVDCLIQINFKMQHFYEHDFIHILLKIKKKSIVHIKEYFMYVALWGSLEARELVLREMRTSRTHHLVPLLLGSRTWQQSARAEQQLPPSEEACMCFLVGHRFLPSTHRYMHVHLYSVMIPLAPQRDRAYDSSCTHKQFVSFKVQLEC